MCLCRPRPWQRGVSRAGGVQQVLLIDASVSMATRSRCSAGQALQRVWRRASGGEHRPEQRSPAAPRHPRACGGASPRNPYLLSELPPRMHLLCVGKPCLGLPRGGGGYCVATLRDYIFTKLTSLMALFPFYVSSGAYLQLVSLPV